MARSNRRFRADQSVAHGPKERIMGRYPNISDHGLIGDLQTAALVTTDGTVDWFCSPRFDSPSVCASLLDADRGGYFRIAPDRDDYVSKQLYLPDTAILVTRFLTPDGVGEVHDFMPITTGAATDRHRIVRQLRVVRGTMRFVMDFQPRFDYARKPHKVELTDDGAVFHSDGLELTLHSVGAPGTSLSEQGVTLEPHGDGLRAARTLRAGDHRRAAAADIARGTPGPGRRDRCVLAPLAAPFDLCRPLAGDGRPVGDDAEADDLCADRRRRRGADRRAS
jgi:hypothetical protein